jgi:hypothetical protein
VGDSKDLGITKQANRLIAQILCVFMAANQRDWVQFLALVEFAINSTINRVMGISLFEINYDFMPRMMHELPSTEHIPPGVRTFAMNALRNMAVAHDSIIAERVFQHHYTNKHRHSEPEIRPGELVYLSMKNLALPKGRASTLLPKYVGPYKVLRAFPETSNYELELPAKLKCRRIHQCFHVGLLRPHHANDDLLFPNRRYPDPYNFGAPDDAEWFMEEIMAHRWRGCNIEFEVKWSLGDTTWEPLGNCNELAVLDAYLTLMGIRDWQNLPRRTAAAARRRK